MSAGARATGPFRRYMFEQGFHAKAASGPKPVERAAVFSEADVARERDAGFAAGRTAGLMEAGRATEVRLASSLEAVAEEMSRALAAVEGVRAAAIGEAVAVAAAIGAKLLPALYRREGASEIEAVVDAVLPDLIDEPRVVVRLNPEDLPALAERLAVVADRAGFGAKLTVRGDGAVAAGDCRIDWASGGAERDGERRWHEIEAALLDAAPLIETLAPARRLRLGAPSERETTRPAGEINDGDINNAGGSDV